jgi:hypothetical protein
LIQAEAILRALILVLAAGFFTFFENAFADGWGSARITGVYAYDRGDYSSRSEAGLSLDVRRETCPDGRAEPFFDTIIEVQLHNYLSVPISIHSFSYTVPSAFKKRRTFRSSVLAVFPGGVIQPHTGAGVYSFFLGMKGARKRYLGGKRNIPDNLGIRNVMVRLEGVDALGRPFSLRSAKAFSFGAYNNCPDR